MVSYTNSSGVFRLVKHWALQQRTTSTPEAQQHLPSHLYSAYSLYQSPQLVLFLAESVLTITKSSIPLNCKRPVVLPEGLHHTSGKEYVQRHLHKGSTFQCVTVCPADHFWGLPLNPFSSYSRTGAKVRLHIKAQSQFQLPFKSNHNMRCSYCIHVNSNITADLKTKPLVSCVK